MTTITPSARPNIAPSDDRIKELRKRASNYGSLPESTVNDILDDYSVLKAEVKRLNTWHSTLSEAWKTRAEKSEAENERLKTALWDALKNRPIKVTVEPEGATDLLERLRKAEAELKVAGGTIEEIVKAWCLDKAELVLEKMLTADLTRDVNEAHTQLAKRAPLIEAVMADDSEPSFIEVQLRAHMNVEKLERLLRAALKLRDE